MTPVLIGQASGPIIGGPTVMVYPQILIATDGTRLTIAHGRLETNDLKLWPAGEALSRDLVRQILSIRRAYQESIHE